MRHRCDSRIIYYLTLMTFDSHLWHIKTPEMTGMKSKFRSKFRFRLYSVPATGRNFPGILNLAAKSNSSKHHNHDGQSNTSSLLSHHTTNSPQTFDILLPTPKVITRRAAIHLHCSAITQPIHPKPLTSSCQHPKSSPDVPIGPSIHCGLP
jgi:hypothetical protein